MARKRKVVDGSSVDSRQRLVETAGRLFRVQGYHATGLNQIVEESQSPKGSLYHYFPEGKEQLAVEALVAAGRSLQNKLKDLGDSSPADALERFVEMSIAELEGSDYRDGCPIATVALETNSNSEPLREVCRKLFDRALLILKQWLMANGVAAERAEVVALTVFSAIEGALILSKVQRSPEPLRKVAGQMKQFLNVVVG